MNRRQYWIFGLWVFILLTTLWMGWWYVPMKIEKLEQIHEEIKASADLQRPQYDCYEFYGDYPTEEERNQYRAEYAMPIGADRGEPGPMLDCEAGDHTCID